MRTRRVALAFLKRSSLPGRVFAGAVRLWPEAVVDVAVERLDVELGIDGAAEAETQIAVDRLGFDARVARQRRRTQLQIAVRGLDARRASARPSRTSMSPVTVFSSSSGPMSVSRTSPLTFVTRSVPLPPWPRDRDLAAHGLGLELLAPELGRGSCRSPPAVAARRARP